MRACRCLWGALLCLTLVAAPCRAKTLVVMLLPGTSLSDWQRADAPILHEVMATGAVAVMNTRTARQPSDHVRETPESAVLTLGAGARAAGGPEATDFVRADLPVPDLDLPAGTLFARRMGLRSPPGSWVNVQWPRVLAENMGLGYDIHLGSLADVLQRAGVTVKALGGPLAYALGAKGTGVVLPPAVRPGVAGDRCIFWDAGSDVAGADAHLGALLTRLGDGRLIVLSPSAGDAAYARGDQLCPVAVWGADIAPGLISSAATRRAGLITDTEFAVTVADYFGLPVKRFPVRPFGTTPWSYVPSHDGVRQTARLESGALRQWRAMKVLPYLAIFLGLWMPMWTALLLWRRLPPWAGVVPACLILALTLSGTLPALGLWLVVLVGVSAVASRLGARRLSAGLSVGILAALISDMLLGDPLMRMGLLGYSAIEGARYYGIGNEAMGALIGASLVTADALWPRLPGRRRWFLWSGLALVTAFLGSPAVGAKAGGLLVAPAAFFGYAWLRSGRSLNGRVLLGGITALAAILTLAAFMDARLTSGQQSHFGQAVMRLRAGGAGEWGDIIARKLAVEGHLLYHSAWAVPLWLGLGSLVWMARRPPSGRPFVGASVIAVAACLAFNDAGTEAAALCLSLLWGWAAVGLTGESPGLPGAMAPA